MTREELSKEIKEVIYECAPELEGMELNDDTVINTKRLSFTWSAGAVNEIEKGWVIKGETIEELAEKIGANPEILAKTIEKWNGFVDAGEDAQFGRSMNGAPRLDKAPYYAIQIKPTQYNTQGGARRNE